jgi:hypothetical protein
VGSEDDKINEPPIRSSEKYNDQNSKKILEYGAVCRHHRDMIIDPVSSTLILTVLNFVGLGPDARLG